DVCSSDLPRAMVRTLVKSSRRSLPVKHRTVCNPQGTIMRILNFIGSLLPSFKKNEVTEHLNALRENITSQTVPVFEQAVADMKGGKLNSKAGQAYTKAFNKAKPVPYRGEWMEATLQTLQNMQVNVETIANLVGDS